MSAPEHSPASDKAERLLETAMAALQATPGGQLNIVVLNKVLFYTDLLALRDFGETVTHNDYIALPQGPVVASYERRLVKALKTRGLAVQDATTSGAKPVRVVAPLADFPHLTPQARAIAEAVARDLAGVWSKTASAFSHENLAWRIAYNQRAGTPINMILALQQVIADDPWMNAPPTALEAMAIASAGSSTIEW